MAERQKTINAAQQQVWTQITDPWVYTGWVVGAAHIRGVDPQWPAVGSRIYHQAGGWPLTIKDSTQVEEQDEPGRLVLLARGWPLGEARVRLELSSVGDERTLVVMNEVPVAGPGSWINNPLTEAVLARRIDECLSRLAVLAENRH